MMAAAGVTDGLNGDQNLVHRARHHRGRDVGSAGRHDGDLREERGDLRWDGLRRRARRLYCRGKLSFPLIYRPSC